MSESSAHNWADKQSRTADVLSATTVTFGDMMLRDGTIKGLNKAGYQTCSPIQTRAIPLGRSGLDLLVQAKSGTGKTLVFAVCILETFKAKLQSPQSLVIAPTREIAVQIEDTLRCVGSCLPEFKVESFIGGLDINEDRRKIQNCSAVIGTPGRILHLMKNNVLNVTNIRMFVLDEADKLMADSFRKDVLAISHRLSQEIQTLALSATFEDGVDKQLAKMMQQPIGVTPKREVPILLGVKQFGLVLPPPADSTVAKLNSMQEMYAKVKAINDIFEKVPFKQCLIFMNSNQRAESYCNYLSQSGWSTDVMMGRLEQTQRLHTYKRFKNFEIRILVCTDLMARGVDSKNVNLVINLDVPANSTTYLHRIGRAGRFGTRGMAVTLMTDAAELQQMAVLLGTLGGSQTFITKFPLAADVDVWEYETLDVRDKYFGVEVCSAKRAENESMRAIRRKCKLDKEMEKETPAEKDEDEEKFAPVLGATEDVAHIVGDTDESVRAESAISTPETSNLVVESPIPTNWDALMAKLTSNVNVCQLDVGPSAEKHDPLLAALAKGTVSSSTQRTIVEENLQLMTATKWMVDDMQKQPTFGLHLPMDLFGPNDLTNVPIKENRCSNPVMNIVADVADIADTDHTAAMTDITVEQTATAETSAITVAAPESLPTMSAADSTNSDPANANFDRLLLMLSGNSASRPQKASTVPDNKLIDLLAGGENSASIPFDSQLFGCTPNKAIVPDVGTELKVDAVEFVPLKSRRTGQTPDSDDVTPTQHRNVLFEHDYAATAVLDCVNDNPEEDGKLLAVEECAPIEGNGMSMINSTTLPDDASAPAIRKPACQPSNIPGIMWTTVVPQVENQQHHPVDITIDDLPDADDNTDDRSHDGASETDDVVVEAQQYFQAGLDSELVRQSNGHVDKVKRNWNAAYQRQLQQIHSYVQYTMDFNRAFH